MGLHTTAALFFNHWVATRGHDECWPWQHHTDPHGYGRMGDNSYAHLTAYALLRGRPPASMRVAHSCRNPACCNPNHLYLQPIPAEPADTTHTCPRGHPSSELVYRKTGTRAGHVDYCRICRRDWQRARRQRERERRAA